MSEDRPLKRAHILHGKRVAILGGGPAGLTLARLLQLGGVEVVVYERAPDAGAHSQGGSLDLHGQSGQLAIGRCGLSGQFRARSRPEGQASVVYNKFAELQLSRTREDEAESAPEIDRGELLGLLRSSLADRTIAWARRLVSLAGEPAGGYRLIFAEGPPTTADVVIGCDGIRSRVRAFLGLPPPVYTGVTFMETKLVDADAKHPDIARMVGPGSALALGDNKGLLAQRNGDGSIRVYAARRVPEYWIVEAGLDAKNPSSLRSALLSWFDDWSPLLVRLLGESDESFLPWPLYAMAPEPGGARRPGITVIGDAAHVMPPFLGAGANMAMLDAVELADHLILGEYDSVDGALEAFEAGMWKRMGPMVRQALATQETLFADDAPAGLIALITRDSDVEDPRNSRREPPP
jgi:2-polyprenyl-6-methoxyphenol hydroxylase-like FAD-dependent oxidoreductase